MSPQVFISHSSLDKSSADAVCVALEQAGIACWIAPRDIRAGQDWSEAIVAGIETAPVTLLIFSSNADASLQVRREVQRAFETGKVVVPFRIEDIVPNGALNYYLGPVHWFNALSPPLEAHLPGLVAAVQTLLPARASPKEAVPENLGKDLAPPESISPSSHPNNPPHPNNLPHQVTTFIGRETQLSEVAARLEQTRLLTLIGSGGSGKSRLSVQSAADLLARFPHGAWLVELAPLADPSMVAQTGASVLGIQEENGKPILTTLAENLKPKKLLLLLDNCEHVLDANARLADTLLRACPDVQIIATSREGLGISGETTYRVPSLSLPDPKETHTAESLIHFESVRLFVDRALQTQPSFAVTDANASALVSICCRLDGIPLAIELAAARARSLSVEEINTRLDQRFRLLTGGSRTALPRQQTLRSMIDWSYDLLNDAEKALFCRLSVFAGGWTVESAEAVCSGDVVEDWEVLDLLTSLCDKTLVVTEERAGATRYRFLETVRQYARERLPESGAGAAFRDRHLAFFMALGEELKPQYSSPQLKAALDRFEDEIDNIRAALEWSRDAPERAESGLRLALAVTIFWGQRGFLTEGWNHLAQAMASSDGLSPSLRARGLFTLGNGSSYRGDFVTGVRQLEESLTIRQKLGERLEIAETLNALGISATYQKDYALSRQHLEESLRVYRELGDQKGISNVLTNLANITYYEGDIAASRPYYEESLKIKRALGNPYQIYVALLNLGESHLMTKDYAAAGAMWRECLALVVAHNLKGSIPWALNALAGLLAVTDTPTNAARLWGKAERLIEEANAPLPIQVRELISGQVAAARAALGDEAAFDAAWQEGRQLTLEQAVALAQQESSQPLLTDLPTAG